MKKLFFVIISLFLFFGCINIVNANVLEPDVICKLDDVEEDCNSLFGDVNDEDSTAYFLNEIFGVFKWMAPLLCLAFSVVEFVKAAASQDKEALNKAGAKTVKRIILALVLFFIPSLINFLFPLLGWYSTCGIG